MTIWITLAIVAQLFAALTVFIDKYVLVSKAGFNSPTAFAFYTAMLSGFVLILVPFGVVSFPSAELALLALMSSMLYITSLVFLYRALQELSVTEVIPITTASGAITTGILATIFLRGDFPISYIPAFLLLVVGTFLIYCFCFSLRFFFMTVAAGALIGASTFVVKFAFGFADFWTALFWTLFTNVIVALLLLAPTRFYAIVNGFKSSSAEVKLLALFSKSLGGFAFFLTFTAISLGSVTLINAMGGLQLIFLLILVPVFIRRVPDVFRSEFLPGTVVLKIIGTICIALGLTAIFLL